MHVGGNRDTVFGEKLPHTLSVICGERNVSDAVHVVAIGIPFHLQILVANYINPGPWARRKSQKVGVELLRLVGCAGIEGDVIDARDFGPRRFSTIDKRNQNECAKSEGKQEPAKISFRHGPNYKTDFVKPNRG